jgi:aspartyl-tRNA(Asn)/glutamyl-tRNA(Gln) amidotransferase subunit A
MSASDLGRALRSGEISSLTLTEYFLKRIETFNPQLNAFISISKDQAREQAKKADLMIAKGEGDLLTGVPFAHKDLFCTAGIRTTAGSKMLENFVPPYDATVTKRIYESGMVVLGKTNMDEFAMGSANDHSYFGPCSNPFDLSRVPGGSSGGSACAVAAGLAPFATGSDTGGSVRQPASYCHLVGLKPSYGRVSRFGMIAFASSLDQAGILSRSVEDAARMLSIMAGSDDNDSTCSTLPVPNYIEALKNRTKLYKIAVPESFFKALDAEGQTEFLRILDIIKDLGHHVEMIELPIEDYVIPTYYVIAPAEASSNLSRYDGIRYGHRTESAQSLEELYIKTRSEGFGEEVKRRILIGTYVLSSGYYDAYYQKALKIRQTIKNRFATLFQSFDMIATPTTLAAAFQHHAHDKDPVAMYYSDLCTVSVNLADLPGISLPLMTHQGLPMGFQLIGRPFDEETLLCLSSQLEEKAPWNNTHSLIALKDA